MFKLSITTFIKPILLAALTFLIFASVAGATTTIPAQVCQPANMNQALALNLGWTPLDTRNLSALNENKSLFVVCPLQITGDDFTSIGVDINYYHIHAKRVTCSLFTNLRATAIGFYNQESFPQFFVSLGSVRKSFIPSSLMYFESGKTPLAVVCALHPQTGINSIFINGSE